MRFFKSIGLYFLYWILRFLISLRYRIEVKGFKEIVKSKKQGMLFLPNHSSEMDPLIMMLILWRKFKPKPLVIEHFYYLKGFRFFMDLVGAIPLPTMDMPNPWKARRVEKLKEKFIKKLKEKENFLIFPSGKLKLTAEEQVGGASLIPELLNLDQSIDFVLVRITGLWGSHFSRALTGVSPDFGMTLWKGFKILLKNGIFFAPKRKVTVELAFPPEELPRSGDKMEINRAFEQWYNKDGLESLRLVSTAFWREELPEVKPPEKREEIQKVPLSEEMRVQIVGYLAKLTRHPISEIKPNLHFSNDLGLDSLDVSQLYIFLEERFDITGLAPAQLQTVGDMFEAAAGVKKETEEPLPPKKKSKWPHDAFRPPPQIPSGQTLQELFLETCDRMGETTACADALSGVLSYRKMKRGALVLSVKIQQMPGDYIGVLLPSSVAAYVTILAVLMAGKTPVMLNWTAGFRNLEHAAEVCSLKTVLSSFRFLSRLETGDLGKVDDLLLLLEEVRRNLSLKVKLKGLYLTFFRTKALLKKFPHQPKETDPAVVIFTSGTETLPKGVPLTHYNIISNLRSALSCISINAQDVLYGVLPPFHSFGFSVTGMMPLISGVKVCYAPDPTDSKALANDIEHWKPTLFCCAPSFIMGVLRVAKNSQLESLRMTVTGAEKAPQELFDSFKAKGKLLIEGYGISECSPIVTLEREGEPHKGVGKPLPNVELKVIDPETEEILDFGKEGEICIAGSNVFDGYLGVDKDPFIELDGKKWYRSGDRGYLDPDGTLILTGRLKRFVKIGGEMVSLGGLEEDILAICMKNQWVKTIPDGAILAVTAIGRESEKPQIILFTTFDMDREALNQELKQLGHSRLVRVAEIRKMDEIPLTGTGKIHYRMLDELL